MKHFRKHGKKDTATKLDVQSMINEFKAMMQGFAENFNQGKLPPNMEENQKNSLVNNIPKDSEISQEKKPKSLVRYIEERLECQSADDYDRWLENLEKDTHLSSRDKQTAKTATL